MADIFQSSNFIVTAPERPHVDREEGGHIKIAPVVKVHSRQDLTPIQAIELARLQSVVGEAMKTTMNSRGINVERINYQDMGNWAYLMGHEPYCHIHVYGRARSAKIQKFGHACYLPFRDETPDFYKGFKPLNAEDILAIKNEIEKLLTDERYRNDAWGLGE